MGKRTLRLFPVAQAKGEASPLTGWQVSNGLGPVRQAGTGTPDSGVSMVTGEGVPKALAPGETPWPWIKAEPRALHREEMSTGEESGTHWPWERGHRRIHWKEVGRRRGWGESWKSLQRGSSSLGAAAFQAVTPFPLWTS